MPRRDAESERGGERGDIVSSHLILRSCRRTAELCSGNGRPILSHKRITLSAADRSAKTMWLGPCHDHDFPYTVVSFQLVTTPHTYT